MIDKTTELVSLCKASVHITFNNHTTNYNTVEQELAENFAGRYSDVPDDIKQEMIKRNTMVEVQFYTHTPIGSYLVVHYDLNKALDEAIEIAREEQ